MRNDAGQTQSSVVHTIVPREMEAAGRSPLEALENTRIFESISRHNAEIIHPFQYFALKNNVFAAWNRLHSIDIEILFFMAETPFSTAGMRRGLIAAQPLALGVFVYGIAFGLLTCAAYLSAFEAVLMSALVYSGSAQLVAITSLMDGNIPSGTALMTVLATILLLNGRYILYGAAMRPWLGGLPVYQAYPTLAVLGDGNWILSMKAASEGEKDAGFVFATGFGMFVPWLAGTWIGASALTFISDPTILGLDFMLIAFSAAMGMSMFKGRSDVKTVLVAAVVSLVVNRFAPGGAAILAAGVMAGLVTWLTYEEKQSS